MVERVPAAPGARGLGPGAPGQARRPELDALRLLVIFGLIPFHAALIFTDVGDFYVRTPTPTTALTVLVALVGLWPMPLLFMTSGMALSYALQRRSPGAFVVERTRRLLVPFVFGVVVVVPPLTYVELLARPGGHEPYWSFLRRFIGDVRPAWDFPYLFAGRTGLFEAGHLYFIYFLYAFSLLLLPLLLVLRRPRAAAAVRAAAATLARPGAILLLGIPIALLEGWLKAEAGGWNRWVYLLAVLYGCLVAADARIMGSVARQRWVALGAALTATLAMYAWGGTLDAAGVDPFEDGGIAVAWRTLEGAAGWSWVVAVLGFSAALLSGRRAVGDVAASADQGRLARLGRYAQEAVLPVYVLHLTVVVAVGHVVVGWPTNALVQYLAIVAASLAGTLLLFELVRRTPATRFLLGMKPAHGG